MVNRMSSAFRLTPQGSRSTPPPGGHSSEDNQFHQLQQQHNNHEQQHSAAMGSSSGSPPSPSTSMANAVENPAVAVAEGIANGIVGATQIGWCLDNLPNHSNSAIRVHQQHGMSNGGNDVRLSQPHMPREFCVVE